MPILFLIITPPLSYANLPQDSIKWQLIYITGKPACSNYDYQMTNSYRQITNGYLKMYEVDNSFYYSECLSEKKYDDYKIPSDVDLLILVYERGLGRAELNANGVGGVYYHLGSDKTKNHSIIFCDCPNFDYSDPAWILTHELSHFVLYYRGYGPDIVENHVHEVDTKYDYCVEAHKPKLCKDIKAYLRIEDQAYNRVVMAPYLPKADEKSKSDTNLPEVIAIQKQITDLWLEGKIDDSDYLKVLGYDTESPYISKQKSSESYFERSKTIFTDGPKENKQNVRYHDGEQWLTDSQIQTILSRIPFDEKAESNPTTFNNKTIDLPDSFETYARQWLDRKINNNEFFISLSETIKNVTSQSN